jgi:inosine-uridine nucleoside N-ribohydrolase
MHQPLFAHIEEMYGTRAATFPDPFTMAYVVNPAIAREQVSADLKIEPTDSPKRGASMRRSGERVTLITEIDKAGFQSILLDIRYLA